MTANAQGLDAAMHSLVLAYAAEPSMAKMSIEDRYERSVARAVDSVLAEVFPQYGISGQPGGKNVTKRALADVSDAIATIKRCKETRSRIGSFVGETFEIMRGLRLEESDGLLTLETSPERRGKGVYFTPAVLAESIVNPALDLVLKNVSSLDQLRLIRIVDPAAGCGAFLLAAFRKCVDVLADRPGFAHLTKAELRIEIATHCMFGVDIDPIAIAVTRALLRGEVDDWSWNAAALDGHLIVADAVGSKLSEWESWFPSAFPAGFSAVVTNPPWSKLRPLRHEFFEHMDARVRSYQGTALGTYLRTHLGELVKGTWSAYVRRTLGVSKNLRSSPEYTVNSGGAGDADLYKYFTERSVALLAVDGVAALLLPSGVLRAQGACALRSLLRTQGRVQVLIEYLNKKKLFDIHSMYRFCSLQFVRGEPGGIKAAYFREVDIGGWTASTPVELTSEFLTTVGGPDLLVPEVCTGTHRDLLFRIYKLFPPARSPESGWCFGFRRELDMTNDAHAFIPVTDGSRRKHRSAFSAKLKAGEQAPLLPLYEGRMVHQFDSMAKVYGGGSGRSAKWMVPHPADRDVLPHYWVAATYGQERGWQSRTRAGYCEISGHANERTVLACLIPSNAICGNKVPVLRMQEDDEAGHNLWLAFANSLMIDWIMRRWVSTTVNQFYWQNIPLPIRGRDTKAESFLVAAVRRLNTIETSRASANEILGERALIRAAIDAVVFDLYGLSEAEIASVLEDFPVFSRAFRRGPAGSIPLADLLAMAGRALKEGRLESVEFLEASIGCQAVVAAAAYTPRDQAKFLTSYMNPVDRREVELA